MRIDEGETSYDPNSIDAERPKEVPEPEGGSASYPERIDGEKRRVRSRFIYGSFLAGCAVLEQYVQTGERAHHVAAFSFELSKVTRVCRDTGARA